MEKKPTEITANLYDDPDFDYSSYWRNRSYEHAAEEIAVRRFLAGHHAKTAVDVGGGFGRLSAIMTEFADEVILAEPSRQQLDLADKFLAPFPQVRRHHAQAEHLGLPDSSADIAIMVRVMHHLPDPNAAFAEVARVLRPGGLFVLEIANLANGLNRLRYAVKRQRVPTDPVDIRSDHNIGADDQGREMIAFVNHNPATVRRQLAAHGLFTQAQLSVSNLRSERVKDLVPQSTMLRIESVLQRPLARLTFGPSHFVLVKKAT